MFASVSFTWNFILIVETWVIKKVGFFKLLKEKWSENLKFNLVWERNSFLRQHSSKVYLSLSLSCILTAYTSAPPYLDIQESFCYRYTKSLRHELLVKSQTIQTKVEVLVRQQSKQVAQPQEHKMRRWHLVYHHAIIKCW